MAGDETEDGQALQMSRVRELLPAWRQRIDDILLDGKWHSVESLVAAAWSAVPLHLAIRQLNQTNDVRVSAAVSLGQWQIAGAKRYVRKHMSRLRKSPGYECDLRKNRESRVRKVPVYVLYRRDGGYLNTGKPAQYFWDRESAARAIERHKLQTQEQLVLAGPLLRY